MNINKLIMLAGAVVVALLLGLGYTFTQELNLAAKREKSVADSQLAHEVADEMRQGSDDLTAVSRAYVATEDPRYLDYFNEMLAIRSGQLPRPIDYNMIYWSYVYPDGKRPTEASDVRVSLYDLAKQASYTPEELSLIDKAIDIGIEKLSPIQIEAFNAMKGVYKDKDGEYARIGLPNKELAVKMLYDSAFNKAVEEQMDIVNKLLHSVEKRNEVTLKQAAEELATMTVILNVLAFSLLVAIAVLAYLVNKRSRDAQEKAEQENEVLNNSVINILEAVNLLSERDLTIRAPVTEDIIGTVSDSINLLADNTSGVLKGVVNVAGQVLQVSNTVHRQAEQVSKTAHEERQSVQQMIETLFDATQTMNQVYAIAEQSNESASQATDATDKALVTVNRTVEDMESIRETISETEKRIKRLGERSQEISGIVNLINTISERTHVLALNASMQAAVAGEAGRGFAVVAEEVQQLAESSRNATEQIATLVNNIQIETNETINTVNRTISQVVDGSEQAQQAGEQMRRTQEITAELVSQVQNIANVSQQQKEMSAQLLEAVQAIGDSTEKTAEQIEAQNKGTVVLQRAAKSLVDSVSVFKLPAN